MKNCHIRLNQSDLCIFIYGVLFIHKVQTNQKLVKVMKLSNTHTHKQRKEVNTDDKIVKY